jgi:hypothetical protein
VGTNATRTSTSNEAGVFGFPSLPPGIYNLKATKDGFKTVTRGQVEIQVQENARVDFELTVGAVAESVEISAQATLLVTENSTIGTVVENKRIIDLPLNGRDYLQLVQLSPNTSTGFVSAAQATQRQGGVRATEMIAVGGQRGTFNRYTLDGVENTDPNFNTYVIQPSVDAIQEFKVQTGVYPAEFGRGVSQVNVLTKSGTNSYHGSLFEFLRNNDMDAKPYGFTSAVQPTSPLKWNQYGFVAGGPVWIPKLYKGKDRLFFMSNYESFRERRTAQSLYTVPTAAVRGGNFSGLSNIWDPASRVLNADGTISATPFPNNTIPSTRFAATSLKLIDPTTGFYPMPNLVSTGVPHNNLQLPTAHPVNRDTFVLRMDFTESSKSNWAGRYSWGDENQTDAGLGGAGTAVFTNVEQYMGSNTRVISPSLVTETRFGYTRFFNSLGTALAFNRNVIDELAIPGLKGGDPSNWGIPNLNLGSTYSAMGDITDGPYVNKNNSLEFVNNTSWMHGRNSFRFGGEIRKDHFDQTGNQFSRSQISFLGTASQNPLTNSGGDPFSEFLLGTIGRAEAAAAIANSQLVATSFAVYIDDIFKVSSKLTFSYGLRYEFTPPWLDTSGKLVGVYIPALDTTSNVTDPTHIPEMIRQGTGTNPLGDINVVFPNINTIWNGALGDRLVRSDKTNFAPRFGMTWSPDTKWVVRTGGGVFYSQDAGNPVFDMSRNVTGRVRYDANTQFPNLTWSNALAQLTNGATITAPTPAVFANKYERRTPRTVQYMANVQRQVFHSAVLEVGYLGSLSRHLQSLRSVNEAVPGSVGTIQSRRPYPTFGRIQLVDNGGRGNYNALSVKLSQRYASGLTYLVSYTFSRSIDDTSAIRTSDSDTLFPQNNWCVMCERGLSAFHAAQRATGSIQYALPVGKGKALNVSSRLLDGVIGGWQIGTIVTLSTGFPINILDGNQVDRSNTGTGYDRPNATGQSPVLPASQRTTNRWFNTGAYVEEPAFTFGNVGRNTLIGPGVFNVDVSALKDFRVTENHRLQLRVEAFNGLNHPNWGNPNIQVLSSGDGTISSTRTSMRTMQVAAKYTF